MTTTIRKIFSVLLILMLPFVLQARTPSDSETRRLVIAESQATYTGNCPCPDNRASNGRRCGKRSAYYRAGGASPLCYASDVTAEMIKTYRQRFDRSAEGKSQ